MKSWLIVLPIPALVVASILTSGITSAVIDLIAFSLLLILLLKKLPTVKKKNKH